MNNRVTVGLSDIDHIGGVFFEKSPEGLVVTDLDGEMHLLNSSFAKMFGYEVSDLMSKKVEILVPDLQRQRHAEHRINYTKNRSKNRRKVRMEVWGKHKNGNNIPLEVTLNTFSYKNRPWIMAIANPARDNNKLLSELKKERRTAQMYLDTVSTLFILVNSKQEVELINRMGCKILGYQENEIIGKNWFENFIPEHQRAEVVSVFSKLMNGKGEFYKHHKNFIINKEGSERLIDWNNIVIRDDLGNVTGTLSSGIDITKQQQAEQDLIQLYTKLEYRVKERTKELEESQQLYRTIAHNFPNGDIIVLDNKLDYVFAEGSGIYNRGLTGKMLVGKSFLQQVATHQQQGIRKNLTRALNGKNTEFELETKGKTYLISASGLPDINDKINQILVVSQDITRLKNAEVRMQAALQKEMKLNELKSRFVSMASHEFRTPLTSILNSSSLIARYIGLQEFEHRQKKHIGRIKTSVHHLTNILNDFLSLDKLAEGEIRLNPSHFDIQAFASKAIDELDGLKKEKQVILYEHQGSLNIHQDKQVMKTIFNNLLSNAIKYSYDDGIIQLTTINKNGTLTISVKDEGIGIPKDEQNHLFERFHRAKNALNIQGTGLGLNIIKKYMDMIGGNISFESELDKGTAFMLEIPIQPSK